MSGAIDRLGEIVTIAGTSRNAIVGVMSSSQARNYVDPLLVDNLIRPIWSAHVAYDAAAAIGDPVLWGGRSMAVRQIVPIRTRGELIANLLVISEV
jgi:hypothetical protein